MKWKEIDKDIREKISFLIFNEGIFFIALISGIIKGIKFNKKEIVVYLITIFVVLPLLVPFQQSLFSFGKMKDNDEL